MQWTKGRSGNPGGKTKAQARLATLCRAAAQQRDLLAEFMLTVLDGSLTVTVADKDGKPVETGPSVRERMDAARWFADRGWGRVPDTAEAEDGTPAIPPEMLDDPALEADLGPTGCIQ